MFFVEIDLKVASKFFGGRFACGSSVTGDDEIVIQGDVKDDLIDVLVEKWPQVSDMKLIYKQQPKLGLNVLFNRKSVSWKIKNVNPQSNFLCSPLSVDQKRYYLKSLPRERPLLNLLHASCRTSDQITKGAGSDTDLWGAISPSCVPTGSAKAREIVGLAGGGLPSCNGVRRYNP